MVWAGIFIVNAVIFLFLSMPFTVIFSNMLIVFGITISVIFSLKAPAYFVTKEFKRYNWSVEADTQKPKGEDEYDVIIVGSGIGGLTCGALLSKRGYKVLVLEQHYQVGGYCSSFKRKNFVFNAGVENVSGLWKRGPIAFLLKELGLKKDGFFVRNRMRFIFKGKEINVNNLEELIKSLSEMFPEERENIRAFFDEAKKAYEECYKDADVYGTPLPAELIVKVFGARKLLDYPKEHTHFYDWSNKTFAQKLDDHFRSKDLREFLCALLPHFGAEPDKAPANGMLAACISYFLYGGYSPKKAQKFADSLKEFIEKSNGKVLVRHKVDKILTEGRKVKGVKVGDKIFRSPVAVSNANAKTTFLELVPGNNLDKGFVDYIKSLKMSPSCLMVSLGADMELSDYPTTIHNLDDNYALIISSNTDPTFAPEGKASIMLLGDANYHDFPERGTKEYLEKKNKLAEILIQKAEQIIPNLSKHIIVQDVATPKTFERYTSMPEGALYSFDQSIETKRPYFKTSIKGLYLAGASTFPGGGIEPVVISGIICANDICNWDVEAP